MNVLPFNGISARVHRELWVGWDGEAFTIPFRNAKQEIVGIQRRFPDGFKCMVEGSQLGIITNGLSCDYTKPLYITEGASDLSVVLECGLQGIGRPNCSAIPEMIVEFCGPFTDVVIVPDNDKPGYHGACQLVYQMAQKDKSIQMLELDQFNDLMEMFQAEGLEKVKEFLHG
jgi:hypothetical protein